MTAPLTTLYGPTEPIDAPPRPEQAAPEGAASADPAIRRTFLSLLAQGVTSGTSFLTAVAVGRTCTREDFGSYALGLSILLFVRAIQDDLVGAPYTIYCNRRRGEALAAYTGSTLLQHLAFSGIVLVAVLALATALGLSGARPGLAPIVWAVLLAVPFVLLRDHIRQLAIAQMRLGAALAQDSAAAVLQLGSLALLALLGLLTGPLAYVVMGGACGTVCLAWFAARRHPARFERGRILSDWRSNWGFARWALASQLVSRATGYLMPWIIAAVHGEAATGVMAACVTVVNLAGTFISGVSTYLTPRAAHAYAHGGPAALRRVLLQTAALYLITVGAFCLVVLVANEQLLTFVYGSRYAGTGAVLAVLAFGMLANSLGITVGNGLWAIDKPGANLRADFCTLLVTLTTMLCLVGPLGVLGAAIATVAGTTVGTIVRCMTLLRLLRLAGPEPAEDRGPVP